MIGNCCVWLMAVALLRPFNAECASTLAKFLCLFRNGIGIFSFLLAVKPWLSQDADNRVQNDDFASSCNIALLVLMSGCLLLDLRPLIELEVAELAFHYFKELLVQRKSQNDGAKKKLTRRHHEAPQDPPTPPSLTGQQVPRRRPPSAPSSPTNALGAGTCTHAGRSMSSTFPSSSDRPSSSSCR